MQKKSMGTAASRTPRNRICNTTGPMKTFGSSIKINNYVMEKKQWQFRVRKSKCRIGQYPTEHKNLICRISDTLVETRCSYLHQNDISICRHISPLDLPSICDIKSSNAHDMQGLNGRRYHFCHQESQNLLEGKWIVQVKWSVMGHRQATGMQKRNITCQKSGKAHKK